MRYYVVKCSVYGDDFEDENYGIAFHNGNDREYFCEITKDYEAIKSLVSSLNNFHIDKCHLDSIIEDFKYSVLQK